MRGLIPVALFIACASVFVLTVTLVYAAWAFALGWDTKLAGIGIASALTGLLIGGLLGIVGTLFE